MIFVPRDMGGVPGGTAGVSGDMRGVLEGISGDVTGVSEEMGKIDMGKGTLSICEGPS